MVLNITIFYLFQNFSRISKTMRNSNSHITNSFNRYNSLFESFKASDGGKLNVIKRFSGSNLVCCSQCCFHNPSCCAEDCSSAGVFTHGVIICAFFQITEVYAGFLNHFC